MSTRYVLREVEVKVDSHRMIALLETHRSVVYDDITEFVEAVASRRRELTAEGFEAAMKISDATVVVYTRSPDRSIALSTSTLEDD